MMGGGRKTPTTRSSTRPETTSAESEESEEGEDTGEDEGGDRQIGAERADAPRFTDPSSDAQRQIEAFVETGGDGEGAAAEATADAGGASEGIEAEAGGGGGERADDGTGPGSDAASADPAPEPTGPPPDQFDVSVPDGVNRAENAGQFARAMFSEGALSERARSDTDEWGVEPAAESGTGRIGSWPEFSRDNIEKRESLDDTDAATGVTSSYMEVAQMSGESTDSYRAYLTQYGNDPQQEVAEGNATRELDVPEDWQAHSQLATTTFSRSCGVRTPDHTYDPDDEIVAAAGVNRAGRAEAKPVGEISDETAAKVDREEFIDVCATQHLAGNTDLHSENVFADEDGGIHCIDYDRGRAEYPDMATMELRATKAQSSAEIIDRRRDDDFDVGREEITDRAQELAVALEVSGQKERVLRTVGEYDDQFPDTENEHEGIIRNNIETAVESARSQ